MFIIKHKWGTWCINWTVVDLDLGQKEKVEVEQKK